MASTEKKECSIHGKTKHSLRADGRVRCNLCNQEAVQKRRLKIKQMALAHKGGKCVRCGYDKSARALVFHHPDPKSKDFAVGTDGYTRSWKKIVEELDKCELLCSNC